MRVYDTSTGALLDTFDTVDTGSGNLMRYLGPVLMGDGLPGSPEHGFGPRGVATLGLDVIHGPPLVQVLRRLADHDGPGIPALPVRSPPMDLSTIDIPVTYLAGTWDAVTSAHRCGPPASRRHTVVTSNLPPHTLCRCSFRAACQPSSATSLIAVPSSERRKSETTGPTSAARSNKHRCPPPWTR